MSESPENSSTGAEPQSEPQSKPPVKATVTRIQPKAESGAQEPPKDPNGPGNPETAGNPPEGGPNPHAEMLPADFVQFATGLLQFQCETAPASVAQLFGVTPGAQAPRSLLVHPSAEHMQQKINQGMQAMAAQMVENLAKAKPQQLPLMQITQLSSSDQLYGDTTSSFLVAVSCGAAEIGEDETGSQGIMVPLIAIFYLKMEESQKQIVLKRLRATANLMQQYHMQKTGTKLTQRLALLQASMQPLLDVNEHQKFQSAAMAFCNTMQNQLNAERVSLGLVRGRYVNVLAMSHTEQISRKMQLVQDLERAMEEAVDQDVEITFPRPEHATFVGRATEQLSNHHGPHTVLSVPVRHLGEPVGALLVERDKQKLFQLHEVETIRLSCELLSPRLLELDQYGRPPWVKASKKMREFGTWFVGAKHTWAKLGSIAALLLILFMIIVKGPDRVTANFQIHPEKHRVLPAHFDGRLVEVKVEVDQEVKQGQVLAHLDTVDLQLERAALTAEMARFRKEADLALEEGEIAKQKMAEINLEKASIQKMQVEEKIRQAEIKAPIDGVVIKGDLDKRIGGTVQRGEILFEVAPLSEMRAELSVPEKRISDVRALMDIEDTENTEGKENSLTGRLASVADPGDTIPFEVERINPVAEVIEQENVFQVRVHLLEKRSWLKPGMKGVARVQVGRRPYGEIWTRDAVAWLKMKWWEWSPF